nr:hypothetical protein [Streptomyces shenzhenensis]
MMCDASLIPAEKSLLRLFGDPGRPPPGSPQPRADQRKQRDRDRGGGTAVDDEHASSGH